MRITYLFIVGVICSLLAACVKEQQAKPRPRLYPKIEFPTKNYRSWSIDDCPFSMEIPEYAKIEKKSAIFDEPIDYPCWFDIQIEELSATIHCSYYNIENRASYDDLVNDAFTMASKHNVKANYREDIPVVNAYGSTGILFKIEGPVASPYQFYLTDSTSHFLRGSLYFNRKVDYDSVTTIVQFIEKDIEHLMASVRWE